jgi:hypothetical protein
MSLSEVVIVGGSSQHITCADQDATLPHAPEQTYFQPPLAELEPFLSAEALKNPAELIKLEQLLLQHGTFDLHIENKLWQDCDGESQAIKIVLASATGVWPMGTNIWIRDMAIVGERLSAIDPLGKEILLSAVTLMSSVSQLGRFIRLIETDDWALKHRSEMQPHIFLHAGSNLNAANFENWGQKQDAWQILAVYVLEAIEKGTIALEELTPKHREFLALAVPFLAAIDFTNDGNFGSWEEVEAIRSSVIAWDTKLAEMIGRVSSRPGFEFLQHVYYRERGYLPGEYHDKNLSEACSMLVNQGVQFLDKVLPHECGTYSLDSNLYRSADATLFYLLHAGIPELITATLDRPSECSRILEREIFDAVISLKDDVTGAIARYQGDTYLRYRWFDPDIQRRLRECNNFIGRDDIVPKGREAMWVHPVWQISAWAGEKYLETKDPYYRKIQIEFFQAGLRLITNIEAQSGLAIPDYLQFNVQSWRIPENYITDTLSDGSTIIVPGPHAPLFWGVAEARYAMTMMQRVSADELQTA